MTVSEIWVIYSLTSQTLSWNTRQSELHVSVDDVPDVLVGILSQTDFTVMQKWNFEIDKLYRYLLLVCDGGPID